MKRLAFVCLILCLVAPITMEAKKKPFGNGLFWELSEDGTLTISGNGSMPDFKFNGRSNYYQTPWSTKMRKNEIKKVVICEGITGIGEGAFAPNPSVDDNQISSIREVIFPSTLRSIGAFAFRGLSMKKIILNNGLIYIGSFSFYDNSSESIELPSTIEEVGRDAFGKYSGSWNGNIISLPLWMHNTNNYINYGISKQSWDAYINGIKDLSGRIILASSSNRIITKCTNKVNNNIYIVEEKGTTGLMDNEGNWIVPMGKYKRLAPMSQEYVKTNDSNYYGIITFDGKEIIPTSRGYTSIEYDSNKGIFAFTKPRYTGVCNTQGKEISLTKLPPTAEDIKEDGGYASAVELINGSKKYYKVIKGGHYGLTDSEGKVIIPCEMEALESAGAGFLRFKLNGFYGIVNYAGKILIPTDRGYTKIGDYVSFTKRFAYEMDGWKGECNNLGVQVSKIKVNKTQQSVGSNSSSSKTSNDLATFDLKGNVKKCVKGIETREFDRNGKLIAGKNEKITYDTHGRIISILIGEDVLGGGFKYEYDNFGRVKVESMILSLFGDPVESRTQNYYDTNGRVVRCIVTTVGHTGESDETYSDYIVDSHGNWISRKKNGSSTETRTIEYY